MQAGLFGFALLACILSIWKLKDFHQPTVKKGLYGLFGAYGLWAGSQLVGFFVDDPTIQYWVYMFGLVMGMCGVISWLFFASVFSNKNYHNDTLLKAFTTFAFIGIVITILTNHIHGQYLISNINSLSSGDQLIIDFTIMHIGVLVGGYVVSLLGLYLIIRMVHENDLGSFTFLLSFVFLFGFPLSLRMISLITIVNPLTNFEPVGVGVFGLLITFVFNNPFGDIQPIARKKLIDRIDEGFILIDNNGYIVDYNDFSTTVFPMIDEQKRIEWEKLQDEHNKLNDLQDDIVIISQTIDDVKKKILCSQQALDIGPHKIGTVIILNDITDLEKNRKEVVRHNKQWDHMAGAIAHELRNSLFLLTGYVEQVNTHLDNDDYGKAKESVTVINKASNRITNIVNDLQKFTRYSQTVSDTSFISLQEIVKHNARNYQSLNIVCKDDMMLQAHPTRFNALIDYALDFAVYSDANTITISITDDGIIIEDDGVYEGCQYDEDMFDYESAVPTSEARMRLPIVKSISLSHGWDITLDESYCDGVRYEITGVNTEMN